MKIVLLGFGSRGDVQPLLPVARGLLDAGYTVTLAAGSNFRAWIESRGLAFADIGVDMHQLINSDLGKEWIENSTSSWQEAKNMKAVMDAHSAEMGAGLLEICGCADAIISNLPTFGMAQAIAEKYGKRHLRVMLAPLTPSAYADATMIPLIPRRKTPINRLANYAGIYFIYWIFRDALNDFRQQLGLPSWGYRDFARAWNRMPVLYGVSPLVMPRDESWPPTTVVTGYWFDTPDATWQPPAELAEFLARHPRPVYLGFGSMAAKNPKTTLALLLDALAATGQAGIIYSGWAGLASTEDLPENVLLIHDAPHDWLFPRMGALIHHGGAGTTAAGLRAGVPATVVAHMADQPYWGRRLYELGMGARPIPRYKLSAARLAQAIQTMLDDPAMPNRAAELGARIRAETGVANAVRAITQLLED